VNVILVKFLILEIVKQKEIAYKIILKIWKSNHALNVEKIAKFAVIEKIVKYVRRIIIFLKENAYNNALVLQLKITLFANF
jgi:hypothetical protein